MVASKNATGATEREPPWLVKNTFLDFWLKDAENKDIVTRPEDAVSIHIRSMSGDSTTMDVALFSSVGDLKRELCVVWGVSSWITRLVLGCRVLEKDCCSLHEAGVVNGTELDLILASPSPAEYDRLYEQHAQINEGDASLDFFHSFRLCSQEEKAHVLGAAVADPRIRKLVLSKILLKLEDVETLVSVLETSTTIHVLNLSGNQVSCAGAQKLASVFERNHTIREMYLFNNHNLGHAGRRRLDQARAAAKEQEGRLPVLLLFSS